MLAHLGWRARVCAMAAVLAFYVVIAAVVSVSRINADGNNSGGNGGGDSVDFDLTNRHPRNLAAARSSVSLQNSQPAAVMPGEYLGGGVGVGVGGGRGRMSPRRLRSRHGPSIDWCRNLLVA